MTVTPKVTSEMLNQYCQVGWERRWLFWLSTEGPPGDAGYKLRLRRIPDWIARAYHDRFRALDADCGVGTYTGQCARRFPHPTWPGRHLFASQVEAAASLAKQFHVGDQVRFQTHDLTTTALDQVAESRDDWNRCLCPVEQLYRDLEHSEARAC